MSIKRRLKVLQEKSRANTDPTILYLDSGVPRTEKFAGPSVAMVKGGTQSWVRQPHETSKEFYQRVRDASASRQSNETPSKEDSRTQELHAK